MKIDAIVRRETIYIAVWVGILSLLMEAVFLIIGKWDYTVLLGNLLSGAVVQLCLRGSEGDLAVMAGHIPFMTAIRAGECRFQTEDGEERAGHVDGGLLVVADTETTVLTGHFDWDLDS